MNTSILKNGLLALTLSTALITPTFASNYISESVDITTVNNNEIKITIDKNTTDSEFTSLVQPLQQHALDAKFSGVKRNKNNEIIAIKIKLQDNKGNESDTALSSDNPINSINLGVKKGTLYILSSNSEDFSFNGSHSLSKHFDFSFDNDERVMTINGKKIDFDDIKNKVKNAFVFEEDSDGKRMVIKFNNFDFDFDFDSEPTDDYNDQKEERLWISKKQSQKFHFVDDPEIEKHIIINGKKANFETLNNLAKSNKLKSVDLLKPDTAMSLYGKKAKDGAIIATTK